jgi:lysosomal acid lipase/cholesteryl ester hydrolase
MGNNRGNYYSTSHIKYNPSQKEFWDFDFEEMGTEDQPAQIDYILKYTNAEKIEAYIGHSEGTTQMFIGASLMPNYFKEKVGLFVALAPVVRLDHSLNKAMVLASSIE